MRNIGLIIILYVRKLLGLHKDPIPWWAIPIYIGEIVGPWFPLPAEVPACKWDPSSIPLEDRTCDKQCTEPAYRVGAVNSVIIYDEEWYVCCPVGYSATFRKHPVTGEESVICKKG